MQNRFLAVDAIKISLEIINIFASSIPFFLLQSHRRKENKKIKKKNEKKKTD